MRSSIRSVFAGFRQRKLVREAKRKGEEHRRAAIHINDLASRIGSEADAGELANAVLTMFSRELPLALTTPSVRRRLARAEHETANQLRLIPEQRVAEVWNEYVREIGAPDETIVIAAEIHHLRDATYASAQMVWPEYQSIWTIPNVYAVGSNGKVANGCRAFDALRVLFEMHNLFENLRRSRENLAKGIVLSDQLKFPRRNNTKRTARAELRVSTNPIRSAESLYIREHGSQRFDELLQRLFDQLFPD
jgi:hypothetical protein